MDGVALYLLCIYVSNYVAPNPLTKHQTYAREIIQSGLKQTLYDKPNESVV